MNDKTAPEIEKHVIEGHSLHQPWRWIIGIIVLCVILGLFILGESIVRSQVNNGWARENQVPADGLEGDMEHRVWSDTYVVDGHGYTWVKNNKGIGMVSPSDGKIDYAFPKAEGFSSALSVDKRGQVWVIYRGELKTQNYSNGAWLTYATTNMHVSLLAFDKHENIWIGSGTSSDVSTLNPAKVWTTYTLSDPSVNYITCLAFDDEDRVWAGTGYEGLYMLDPKTNSWTNFNTSNSGLPDLSVHGVAIDKQGKVWIATDRGMSSFDVNATADTVNIPYLRDLVFPSVSLGMALITILAIAFTWPGAINGKTIPDFCIAFVGWFAIHSLFWGSIGLIGSKMGPVAIVLVMCLFVPIPANIVALIILLRRTRQWMALGAFSAFVINSIGIILVTPVGVPYTTPSYFDIISMIPFFLLHRLGL